MKPVIKSYVRAALVAVLPLLVANDDNWQHYLYAVLIAVLAPLARALDTADKEFGLGSDEKE